MNNTPQRLFTALPAKVLAAPKGEREIERDEGLICAPWARHDGGSDLREEALHEKRAINCVLIAVPPKMESSNNGRRFMVAIGFSKSIFKLGSHWHLPLSLATQASI
jgi:hypothetical protein